MWGCGSMFEWKILAAIFAVLIVASSALVSNSGIKDAFLNSTGNIGDWVKGSPLGSLFTTPEKTVSDVMIVLSAEEFDLEMESPVNITAGDSSVMNFVGTLSINLEENRTRAVPSDSAIVVNLVTEEAEIKGVTISRLVIEDIDFMVQSEKTNISATNDRIEIYDFSGDIRIGREIQLSGNVTKVKDEKWSIG
jgi:hypothetical protein